MDLDSLSDKHLHEVERLVGELLNVMRQAKLQGEPLVSELRQLHLQAGDVRRKRYDATAREYGGF